MSPFNTLLLLGLPLSSAYLHAAARPLLPRAAVAPRAIFPLATAAEMPPKEEEVNFEPPVSDAPESGLRSAGRLDLPLQPAAHDPRHAARLFHRRRARLIESPAFLILLPALMPRALLGVLALLLGNLFIVGINQIYDVDIDVVNKPYLPIAAGRLSPKAAWGIVLGSGAAALAIVKATFSPLIFWLFAFGTTIGGLYSVPPIQLKRFPLAAGLTIATCRGFLLNFGVYYATREALGLAFQWSSPVSFLARFMTVYAGVIAVTKVCVPLDDTCVCLALLTLIPPVHTQDLVDIEGDRAGGIETFAMRLGPGKVAKGAGVVLLLNYIHAVATALLVPGFRRVFMAGGHALAAVWLLMSLRKLKPEQTSSLKAYYKRIWDLFSTWNTRCIHLFECR